MACPGPFHPWQVLPFEGEHRSTFPYEKPNVQFGPFFHESKEHVGQAHRPAIGLARVIGPPAPDQVDFAVQLPPDDKHVAARFHHPAS
jgi:hypothetical protein